MLSALKQKLQAKKQREQAIAESQYWKHHPMLRECLQSMRGCCTVVPMELHEALTAVVNIAQQEDTWIRTDQVPADFLSQTVYILWDDARLPVFRAEREPVEQSLGEVTAVAPQTFLISQTMDRVIHYADGQIRLYSVAPEA